MNITWIYSVLLLSACLYSLDANLLGLEKGELCDGGRCEVIHECSTIDVKHLRPAICNFQGNIPVVCCPIKNRNDTTIHVQTSTHRAPKLIKQNSFEDSTTENSINAATEEIPFSTPQSTDKNKNASEMDYKPDSYRPYSNSNSVNNQNPIRSGYKTPYAKSVYGGIRYQEGTLSARSSLCDGGTCVLVSECKTIQDFRQSRPDICSFQGKVPVICCPSTPPPTTPNVQPPSTTTSATTTTLRSIPEKQLGTPNNSDNEMPIPKAVDNDGTAFKPAIGEKSNSKCRDYGRMTCSGFKHANIRLRREIDLISWNFHRVVVNGTASKPKDLTFMALLGYGDQENIEWDCGGSLISEYWVLSAAHCNDHFRLGAAKWIRLGELDLESKTEDAAPVDLPIVETVIHPEYGPTPAVYNDIALYKSRWRVRFTDYIKPICLETFAPNLFYKPIAAGWGTTDFGGAPSSTLQQVELEFVRTINCSEQYGTSRILPSGINNKIQICAGAPGKDTCRGDSGGPLFQDSSDSCLRKQIGITSFGRRCGILPGVYTWVGSYIEWIENIVWPEYTVGTFEMYTK